MNKRSLGSVLRECIRDIESGSRNVETCLETHPECRDDLSESLTLWTDLSHLSNPEPVFCGKQRVQERLLEQIASEKGGRRMIRSLFNSPMARAVAVVAMAILLTGGVAGASAAFGGPNVFSGGGTGGGPGGAIPWGMTT